MSIVIPILIVASLLLFWLFEFSVIKLDERMLIKGLLFLQISFLFIAEYNMLAIMEIIWCGFVLYFFGIKFKIEEREKSNSRVKFSLLSFLFILVLILINVSSGEFFNVNIEEVNREELFFAIFIVTVFPVLILFKAFVKDKGESNG